MKLFRPAVGLVVAALVLAACGGSDPADTASTEPTATSVDPAPTANAAPTATPEPADGTAASSTPDAVPTPTPFVGEWPNRFCVDGVDTTLNLRAEPTTDSEILASLPPTSCELVVNGLGLEDNFQAVRYTTADGDVEGWVSNNFIKLQDPPERIEAAALLFVDAWQLGIDTTQYSYGIDTLPEPVTTGRPVLVEGPDGFGCVLVGDVSVNCAVGMLGADGTEVARFTVGASRRGTDGNDGEPYFEPDFPDGPTVTSFTVIDS